MMMSIREQSKIMEAEERAEKRGKKHGIAIGEERGIIKGEIKKALEIAKSLITAGMSIANVSIHTGLSVDEINALAK